MIAIVIPYYKRSFFRDTLQSLAAQADKRFHVYIGNDASPEDPEELLKEFEGQFQFTYKKFDENLGGTSLTQQWERCIEMIKDEEWLMILGDDDVLGNTVVEEFYKCYGEFSSKANVVRFGSQVIDASGKEIGDCYEQPLYENPIFSLYRKSIGENRSSLSEFVFRKASYIGKGFRNYNVAWHSDDMAVLDFSDNLDIFSICTAVVYVRYSLENISGNKNDRMAKLEADADFFHDLLKAYNKKMTIDQIYFFIKSYDFYVFSSKISFKHFSYLFYLNIKYGKNLELISFFKKMIFKVQRQ